MSDVPTTTAPVVEPVATEPVATTVAVDAPVAVTEPKDFGEAPAVVEPTEPVVEETKAEAAPVEETAAEKTIEPISEGQLSYKGPGLLKSIVPSKKTFWLNDEAVSTQNLGLFLRGEKPDIAHPVAAWASQTGRGLLFSNKKHDADRAHPQDVFALYDATDLKKQSPHEFTFKLNGHNHTFKATSDAERDGWYLSIEKSIELGKASKEEIRESEAYKAEIEKLNEPSTTAGAAKRSQSQAKQSTEADKAAVVAPVVPAAGDEAEAEKKQKKSRSTSRGMFNRLKGKKEEVEQKVVEKKEEKAAEKEAEKTEEAAPVTQATEIDPIATSVAAAEVPAAAEATEVTEPATDSPVEEKSKPSKRNSIFGRMQSSWSGIRSPTKEKEQKDAELKLDTPAKDGVLSENPPVLPETATTEPVLDAPIPAVEEPVTDAPVEAPTKEVTTPNKEKSNFLSGLGFIKRGRSVSPSTNLKKEEVTTEETPAPVETAEPVAAVEEPAVEASADAEKVEEPKTETTTANKRQSVLGSLGRRASKALRGMQAPKKETAAPSTTEATQEEATEVKAVEAAPLVDSEVKAEETATEKPSIGDVVPDAVNVGQPQHPASTITASA